MRAFARDRDVFTHSRPLKSGTHTDSNINGFKAGPSRVCALFARNNFVPLRIVARTTRHESGRYYFLETHHWTTCYALYIYRGNAIFRIIRSVSSTPRDAVSTETYQSSSPVREREDRGRWLPPKSYFMSVDARLITARHVSISQKYLSARPHTALVEEKQTGPLSCRVLRTDIDERESVVNYCFDVGGYHRDQKWG